ncbi:hypothetical protein DL770_002533 [Monosporascus sp. CRB-9-2]|nr:hypothetical protein DL770_002533 [Monosporascus sp. CRB-9-2]
MLVNIFVQAALCLNTWVNPLAFEGFEKNGHDSSWKLYLIYACWVFGEFVFVYFMYVETKGPTLEELVKIIDGPDAVAHVDLEQIEKEQALRSETNEVAEHKV